jgi:hypothetical protein
VREGVVVIESSMQRYSLTDREATWRNPQRPRRTATLPARRKVVPARRQAGCEILAARQVARFDAVDEISGGVEQRQ